MTKVVSEDPPACIRCDGPLGGVLTALMAREPAGRPTIADARRQLAAAAHASTTAVAAYPTEPLRPSFDRTVALERAVAAQSPVASQSPAVPPPAVPANGAVPPTAAVPPQERGTKLPLTLLAVALLLVAGVIAFVTTRNSGSPAVAAPQPKHSAPASSKPKSSASVVCTTRRDAFRFARSRRRRASGPTREPSRAPSRGHSAPTTTATASASRAMYSQLTMPILAEGKSIRPRCR